MFELVRAWKSDAYSCKQQDRFTCQLKDAKSSFSARTSALLKLIIRFKMDVAATWCLKSKKLYVSVYINNNKSLQLFKLKCTRAQ